MDDTGSASKTSTGKVSDPELRLQAIERLLLLAQRYITVVEVSGKTLHKPERCPCTLVVNVASPEQGHTYSDM